MNDDKNDNDFQPFPQRLWDELKPPVSPPKCPACGIGLQGVMAYSCTRTDCPCFARVIC